MFQLNESQKALNLTKKKEQSNSKTILKDTTAMETAVQLHLQISQYISGKR